ncbi:MAG TPA: hypothetical protein VF211_16055 [Burkholderiales bacterium]
MRSLREILIGAFAAILLAALGAAFAGGALLLALGEGYRVAAAAALAAAFLAGALYAGWRVRRIMAERPAVCATGLVEGGEELLRLVSIGVMAYTIARRLRRG